MRFWGSILEFNFGVWFRLDILWECL